MKNMMEKLGKFDPKDVRSKWTKKNQKLINENKS